MRVFLDASALVPLLVARDPWRPRLEAAMRRLVDPQFVTNNWTLYEAMSLARRFGHSFAVDVFQRASGEMTLAAVTADEELEALRRFLAWTDKSASVVDHANLLVALRERCDALLTFDADFLDIAPVAGLEILG